MAETFTREAVGKRKYRGKTGLPEDPKWLLTAASWLDLCGNRGNCYEQEEERLCKGWLSPQAVSPWKIRHHVGKLLLWIFFLIEKNRINHNRSLVFISIFIKASFVFFIYAREEWFSTCLTPRPLINHNTIWSPLLMQYFGACQNKKKSTFFIKEH